MSRTRVPIGFPWTGIGPLVATALLATLAELLRVNFAVIVVRHHLTGLTREEVPEYLTHRLRLAACELALFEPAAVEALFQATQGMPRKVNRLAHYALTSAKLALAPRPSPLAPQFPTTTGSNPVENVRLPHRHTSNEI